MKEPLNAASLHLNVPRQRRQWSSYSLKGPRRLRDRPHSSRRPRHGEKRSCSQGDAERPSPRLRSTGEGAERARSSKQPVGELIAHRGSLRPVKSRRGKAPATLLRLARTRAKPAREGLRRLSNALRIVGKPLRGCPQDQVPQSLTA